MFELKVENMTCGHCVAAVTRAVQSTSPGAKVQVDLQGGRVKVEGAQSEDALIKALDDAGYPAGRVAAAPAMAAPGRKGGCCCS